MKIFITGGTGFVGSRLSRQLAARGHQVTVLDRTIKSRKDFPQSVSFIEADGTKRGAWQEEAARHDTFINLAGASIFSRWTKKNRRIILESRILTTNNLVEAMSWSKHERVRLFSTSAVGYYGFHEDEELTEEAPPGHDFLASVAGDWEAGARKAGDFHARVVICRFGIVLGRKGGALQQMLPVFRSYMGSPLGSGRQWFSWIHEQDLSDIFLFLLDREEIEGPVNCVAPHPVRNAEMTKALGRVLGVPTLPFGVPGFMMKLVLGEFGDVLLKGQKAVPRRLAQLNFPFKFPTMHAALTDLLGS